DHTQPLFAKPTAEFISLETTIENPSFCNELSTPNSSPKILIAGCGTGNQIINASRYKMRKSRQLISATTAWPTQQEKFRRSTCAMLGSSNWTYWMPISFKTSTT
ncbi:MAG: hypothetical protein OXU49_00910, partial [Cyanobacteria bacterium MAG STY2_bin_7]|nr:hypothetical protein [Cyanobacteria bacterium MAG STY2_bin_7]